MTSKKQLKARVRARMAKTGERYAVARAHVVGRSGPLVDRGWALRGGTHPDSAALAGLLAHAGVHSGQHQLDEAMLFGIGGGIGAGYILWEFKHDGSRVVTLGFANRWQTIGAHTRTAAERLGVALAEHATGGAKGAARDLVAALDAGAPTLVWPDRFHIGYWGLPATLDGHGGHPVVAYAHADGHVHLDDRNLAPLRVPAEDLHRARARVGSYRNLALRVRGADLEVPAERLRAAVRAGIADAAAHLSGTSDSFALPAWRKWGRLMTDPRGAKSWPRVFADRSGLVGALASVWEGVSQFGMAGGDLRGLYADFLDRAAAALDEPRWAVQAARWREVAGLWRALGEAAFPMGVPEIAGVRERTAALSAAVADGDTGAPGAEELWRLRASPCPIADVDAVFARMGAVLAEVHAAETAAVAALRAPE